LLRRRGSKLGLLDKPAVFLATGLGSFEFLDHRGFLGSRRGKAGLVTPMSFFFFLIFFFDCFSQLNRYL
jgi:hypothetical protein